MVSDTNADAHLPLRPRDFLILFALSSEPRHGYGIIHEVAAMTDGTTPLDPANLYRAIKRLVREGLVQEASGAGGDDERRRLWTVTDLGHRIVRAEAERLAGLTERARASGLISRRTSR